MCGICGSFALPGFAVRGAVRKSVDRLAHRGPDGSGLAHVDLGWCEAIVGMTRLAIVDRSRLTVPFTYPHLGVTLAFNGEVYNWPELRVELDNGTPWQTKCDAEVVARAWRKWGTACLDHLNGMFAFCLVDEQTHTAMLARDRAGEKPLYYTVDRAAERLHFASEAKALPVPLVEQACADAEVFEFDCLADTPFKDVYRLGPGERIVLRRLSDIGAPHAEAWWRLPDEVDDGMTFEDAVDGTAERLLDAIKLRAAYEVPAAVQLSGGLDSAIFQAVVRCPRVYTLTFPFDDWENLTAAGLVAAGAEVVPVTFQIEEALAFLPAIAFHLDTPATWSALGHWFLGRRMRADGVKVALAGEGADELFAGYSRFRALWHAQRAYEDTKLTDYRMMTDRVLGGSPREVIARLIDRSPDGCRHEHALAIVDRFAPELARPGRPDLVAAACRVEFYTTMQCLLRMADRMQAAHALENRSPFFDHRLMEFAACVPTRHKITAEWSKAPLRVLALRLGIDARIVNEQTKRGMVVPWNRWRAAGGGERGVWDRADFSRALWAAWRSVYFPATAAGK